MPSKGKRRETRQRAAKSKDLGGGRTRGDDVECRPAGKDDLETVQVLRKDLKNWRKELGWIRNHVQDIQTKFKLARNVEVYLGSVDVIARKLAKGMQETLEAADAERATVVLDDDDYDLYAPGPTQRQMEEARHRLREAAAARGKAPKSNRNGPQNPIAIASTSDSDSYSDSDPVMDARQRKLLRRETNSRDLGSSRMSEDSESADWYRELDEFPPANKFIVLIEKRQEPLFYDEGSDLSEGEHWRPPVFEDGPADSQRQGNSRVNYLRPAPTDLAVKEKPVNLTDEERKLKEKARRERMKRGFYTDSPLGSGLADDDPEDTGGDDL